MNTQGNKQMEAGWKLVPVEPTEEMIRAAFAGMVEDQDVNRQMKRRQAMADNYQKMLAAAPQPPVAVGVDERAAFETWARSECGMVGEAIEREGDRYRWGRTADMWATWRARAALAATPSAPSATSDGAGSRGLAFGHKMALDALLEQQDNPSPEQVEYTYRIWAAAIASCATLSEAKSEGFMRCIFEGEPPCGTSWYEFLNKPPYCDLRISAIKSSTPSEAAPAGQSEGKLSPVPWKAVVQAIRAVDAEAAKRGEMFPQTYDAQRKDRRASRRVAEMIEWYALHGGAVAERLEHWPRLPLAAQPTKEGGEHA